MFQPRPTGNFQQQIQRPQPQQAPAQPYRPPMGGGVRTQQPQRQQPQQPYGTYTGPGGVQQGIADPNQGFAQYMAQNPAMGSAPAPQQYPMFAPQQQFIGSGLMPGVPSLYQQPGQRPPQEMMYGQSDVMNDDSAYNRNSMTPGMAAKTGTGQYQMPQQPKMGQPAVKPSVGVQQSFNQTFGQPSFQTNGYMRY
jgi:hypothetical protein